MAIVKGLDSISSIYSGVNKIAKIYKGLDLVYSGGKPKSSISDSILIKSPTFVYTGTVFTTYSKSSDTTAVEGSSYFRWNTSSQSFTPLSVSTGESLPSDTYKLNANSTSELSTQLPYVSVLGFAGDVVLTEKFILNGDDLGYYNGQKYSIYDLNLSSYNSSIIKELEFYNLPEPVAEIAEKIHTLGQINFGNSGLSNVESILFDNAYCRIGIGASYSIGSNVTTGTSVTIKGNNVTRLSNNMLGTGWIASNDAPSSKAGGGLYKLKSLVFNTPNLVSIGTNSLIVNNANINTSGVPHVYIPSSVKEISACNNALYYCNSSADSLFNIAIKDSSNKFVAINTNSSSEHVVNLSDNSIKGLAGISFANSLYDHGYVANINIPSNIKYLSRGCIPLNSSGNTNITLNSNLESYPELIKDYSGQTNISGLYDKSSPVINSVILGNNVTFIPPELFNGSSTFKGGITFNTPSNTNMSIGEKAFYFKSARAVNIYYNAPNTSISGYDWSGNQNITATFVEL